MKYLILALLALAAFTASAQAHGPSRFSRSRSAFSFRTPFFSFNDHRRNNFNDAFRQGFRAGQQQQFRQQQFRFHHN